MAIHIRRDPGPCIVCDAPHTSCTAPAVVGIAIVQMPMRDGAIDPPLVGAVQQPVPALLEAERVQATLPPGQVTSGTYRKKRKG